jgi:RNA polymerase-binding transcription factor DksA
MRETLSAYAVDVTNPESTVPNLDAIEQDLADVETALARLEAGTYWTDEVTGQEIPDEVLAQRPTARRAN